MNRLPPPPDEQGFTLVELLIVAVLGAMILLSTYQILQTNQRTYTAQNAQVTGQQTIRAGMEILFGELRELSAAGGDLRKMTSDSLTVRLMRNFGLICQISRTGTPTARVATMGSNFVDGDSVLVFADVDTMRVDDDLWHVATANVTGTATCGSTAAQELSFPGHGPDFRSDTVWAGAPIRAFEWYTYGAATVGGEWYLARWVPGGSDTIPMVGPLDSPSNGGLNFVYLDADGNTTTTSTDVRQIQVTLKTRGQVRGPDGNMVYDSLQTRIYTRN